MSKKLLLLLLVWFCLIIGAERNEVSAVGEQYEVINWTMENYSGSSYRIKGYTQLLDGTDTITLQLPASDVYVLRNTSTYRSHVTFFDASDNMLGQYDFEDIADYFVQENPSDKYDAYEWDLRSLGLYNTAYGDPSYAYFYVYLDNSILSSWDAGDRADFRVYVESNYEYTVYFEDPDYRDIYFTDMEGYYDSSTHAGSYYYVPELAGAVKITWPNISNECLPFMTTGSYDSYIRFFEGISGTTVYDLKDYTFFDAGDTPLDVGEFGVFIPFPDDYTLGTYTDYEVVLYPNDGQSGYFCQQELNRYLNINFVSYFNKVEYYDGDTMLDSELVRFDELPTQPPTPSKSGYDFIQWVIPSDDRAFRPERFTFDSYVDPDYAINGTVKVYAQWRPLNITTDTDLGTTDPTTGNILTTLQGFGLGSTSGLILTYFIVIFIAVISLMLKGLKGIPVLIVVTLITSIFTFLGFLPTLLLVLVYTIIIGLGVVSFGFGSWGVSSE